MLAYCVTCKKNTANENSNTWKTKENRQIYLSNCAVCGKKTSYSAILIIFEMISLKWIKSLTSFCWLKKKDYQYQRGLLRIVYNFFDQKKGLEAKASVNEAVA